MLEQVDYVRIENLSYNIKVGTKGEGELESETDDTIMNYGSQGQERLCSECGRMECSTE